MSAGDRQQGAIEELRQRRAAAQRAKAQRAGRDSGTFVAWLTPVQQSPGWCRASHTARSLLMDMLHSGPNGRLNASLKYLRASGWTSAGTVTRAVAELVACGLLIETRKGARPNKTAWFACTWLKLRHTEGLDINPRTFETGGYMTPEAPEPTHQRKRTAAATAARQMNAISRADGYTPKPSDGDIRPPACTVPRTKGAVMPPSDGAMRSIHAAPVRPSDGVYLDITICTKNRPPSFLRCAGMSSFIRRARPDLSLRPAAYHAARDRFDFPH